MSLNFKEIFFNEAKKIAIYTKKHRVCRVTGVDMKRSYPLSFIY